MARAALKGIFLPLLPGVRVFPERYRTWRNRPVADAGLAAGLTNCFANWENMIAVVGRVELRL